MKPINFRANTTELNKSPHKVKFVWIIEYVNDTISTTVTHQTLVKIETKDVNLVRVVDIQTNKVHVFSGEALPALVDAWRDNYFNPDWQLEVN